MIDIRSLQGDLAVLGHELLTIGATTRPLQATRYPPNAPRPGCSLSNTGRRQSVLDGRPPIAFICGQAHPEAGAMPPGKRRDLPKMITS
jgi:hypothetical protein